jgi:hypothetical protein
MHGRNGAVTVTGGLFNVEIGGADLIDGPGGVDYTGDLPGAQAARGRDGHDQSSRHAALTDAGGPRDLRAAPRRNVGWIKVQKLPGTACRRVLRGSSRHSQISSIGLPLQSVAKPTWLRYETLPASSTTRSAK